MKPKRGNNKWKKSYNNQPRSNQKREYRHCDQLSEKDVGITEYMSNLNGFTGIIKARYSDFQLNEIDLDGNIAKLTNTDIPKDFALKLIQYNYHEVIETPISYLPQETWESIKKIVDSDGECVQLDSENLDKDARKQVHECIKKHFGNKIIASTVQLDGKRVLQFQKCTKENTDIRTQWPVDKGEHVYFIVYKEKMDTLEALFKISSAIGMGVSQFHHAGNKDKRSITSQWFSCKKVAPWKLITKTKCLPNIRVGNITFKDKPLRLGNLKGNKFRIALRNVTAEDEVINETMMHLKEHNFVNYYGMQRFGNDKEVPTYKIGISLLLGKWKEAVEQILKPKLSDDVNSNQGDIVKAKKIYAETGDADKAYDALQRNKTKSLEGKLLEGLKNSKANDYVNALERVPRSMRLLYLHAFQSLIWNKMVSKRLQLFGLKPVVDDLVLIEETPLDPEEEIDNNDNAEIETEIKCNKQVKTLTEEDLEKYTIYDVVLPLPGYDVVYPKHMINYYKESIEEHGLELEMTRQKVRSYSVSGDYRKLLEKVEELSWKIVHYNNPTDNLIISDLQEMKGEKHPQTAEDGKYKAVIMEFSLPACSYATMVLREILKIETSSNAQSKLNNYFETDNNKSTEKNKNIENEESTSQSSSLLSDPAKYELFKNSIFNVVSEKRPNSDDSEPAKRQKIEENT